MDISFRQSQLRKYCNDDRKLKKQYGLEMAKAIRRRLDDLRAVPNLEDMRALPGRCHELHGNLAGHMSLDLRGPYRLLFVPAHNPLPTTADNGIDWSKVTAIEILGVEDPHE